MQMPLSKLVPAMATASTAQQAVAAHPCNTNKKGICTKDFINSSVETMLTNPHSENYCILVTLLITVHKALMINLNTYICILMYLMGCL